MASIRAEFLDGERELMWQVYDFLGALLEPKALKPPMKNPEGKWHFYVESSDHKRKTKEAKKTLIP